MGHRCEFDDFNIIGSSGLGERNSRGDLLLEWCTFHNLVLENTFSGDAAEDLWTYSHNGSYYILDYILVDKCLHDHVSRCFVMNSVDIGSDHRPICLMVRTRRPKLAHFETKHHSRGFKVDPVKYGRLLEEELQHYPWKIFDTSAKAHF